MSIPGLTATPTGYSVSCSVEQWGLHDGPRAQIVVDSLNKAVEAAVNANPRNSRNFVAWMIGCVMQDHRRDGAADQKAYQLMEQLVQSVENDRRAAR